MVIPRDRFFYPSLTRIMDSFSCSPLDTTFYSKEKAPRSSSIHQDVVCNDDVTLIIAMTSLADHVCDLALT